MVAPERFLELLTGRKMLEREDDKVAQIYGLRDRIEGTLFMVNESEFERFRFEHFGSELEN